MACPPPAVWSVAAGYAHDVVPTVGPMLARLERELPMGPGLRYEAKWDGFRCLARGVAGEVVLTSRNDRADFSALMARLHPAVG